MVKIRLGLFLMFLLALLVLVAGWYLARQDVETWHELDRETVHQFSETFQQDLDAFREETQINFLSLSQILNGSNPHEIAEKLKEMRVVKHAVLFRRGRQVKEWSNVAIGYQGPRLPEMIIEGRRRPLVEETAVILTRENRWNWGKNDYRWLASADGRHRVFWRSLPGDIIVALLIDDLELQAKDQGALLGRIAAYSQDLLGSGGHVVIERENESAVLGQAPSDQTRPEVMLTPFSSHLGTFWLRVWNRVETKTIHRIPILILAAFLSLLLSMTGMLFYRWQAQSWEDARQRVSFVNRVSHELGTPLTNMTLNLDLASRTLRSKPEAAGAKLEKVREEMIRLGRLVNNVLTHSRKEQGTLHESKSLCSPDDLVGGVVEQFSPALERRGFTTDWQGGSPDEVLLDSDALTQIVWNLISNVEKYASDGKWLGVATRTAEKNLVVDIQDRGKGVDKQYRTEIFQAFARINQSANEGVSGAGLGLSISRDLARLMGGRLELLEQETGAHFRLTIPFEKTA